MKVQLVTAKRFNSIFKQFVGYRKHNDLRTQTIKDELFFERGVGLREFNTWFYTVPTCVFMLVRRLNYDNRIFKIDKEFYRLNAKWLVKELEPFLIEKDIREEEYKQHLNFISKHGEEIWKYVEQTSAAKYLNRFYTVQKGLQNQT